MSLGHTISAQSLETSQSHDTSGAKNNAITPGAMTAAAKARGLNLYRVIGLISDDGRQRISGTERDVGERGLIEGPPDVRLDTLIEERAKTWAASLDTAQVHGLQLDPAGRLFVAAERDAVAKQQFAARLATPGLSIGDRAYTLCLAVTVFGAKASNTARMRAALDYMSQLDALPNRVSLEKIAGHFALADTYYRSGNGAETVTHLRMAFALVPSIPFADRVWFVGAPIGGAFLTFADVMSGQPQGRATIDSVGTWLSAYTKAPPELLAQDTRDSLVHKKERRDVSDFKNVLQMTAHFGRPAPPIIANYWWNTTIPTASSTAATGAKIKALDDGIIRVMELGEYECIPCLLALPKMERLRAIVPAGVETWFVSGSNGGVWGTTPCTPDEEAQHLKHYYLERKKYGLSIALYIGGRHDDPDGGSLQGKSPTFAAYPIEATPTFVVTDGHGIVRHVSLGFDETLLSNAVNYLLAEAKHPTLSTNATAPAP